MVSEAERHVNVKSSSAASQHEIRKKGLLWEQCQTILVDSRPYVSESFCYTESTPPPTTTNRYSTGSQTAQSRLFMSTWCVCLSHSRENRQADVIIQSDLLCFVHIPPPLAHLLLIETYSSSPITLLITFQQLKSLPKSVHRLCRRKRCWIHNCLS